MSRISSAAGEAHGTLERRGSRLHYEFNYQLSDELLRASGKRFLLYHIGWRVPITFVLMLLVLVPICLTDEEGYMCGLFGGAVILLLALAAIAYLVRNRRAMQFARKLSTRSARCTVTDDGITLENALATSILKWALFQKVVRGPDVWLFFLAREQYFALPADRLDADIGAFIESRVTAAGGRMY